MKKTCELTHPKIKYPRLVEAAKHEIRKYLRRERKKALPEGADFWDFDCKFGDTEAVAKPVHLSDIDKCIDVAAAKQLTSFYVEILAKPGHRTQKRKEDAEEEEAVPKPLSKLPFRGFESKNPES